MATILIQNRASNIKTRVDYKEDDTILDLKKKLSPREFGSVLITVSGKILRDETPLSVLKENAVLVVENDVEFSDIAVQEEGDSASLSSIFKTEQEKIGSRKIRVRVDGVAMDVLASEIFYKNGKPHLVTSRSKRLNIKNMLEMARTCIGTQAMVQALLVLFIITSRNYYLVCIFLVTRLLSLFSTLCIRSKLFKKIESHTLKSAFMFMASMFAIDHDKFHR